MGTPELAVPALQTLAELCTVTCVVTQPDRPAGRGKQLRASPVKEQALALGLPVWQPETLRGQKDAAELQNIDFFVVMAYGEILRQSILDLPTINCINIHCSLLPRWRGASPLQAALRAGDTETGVSIMKMLRALDAGPVYLQKSFPLTLESTLPEVHDKLAQCAAETLGEYLNNYQSCEAQDQEESLVTYCGKLSSDDGHLNFNSTAEDLCRWVRAYTPVPGCWVMMNDKRVKITAVSVVNVDTTLAAAATYVQDKRIFVGCAEGAIEILSLQPQGKRVMRAAEFLNGQQIPAELS